MAHIRTIKPEAWPNRLDRKDNPTMAQGTPAVTVPLHFAQFCGHRNPRTGKPCRRAESHTGRHAFIWRYFQPGTVREVWTSDCQVCGIATNAGAVCVGCGS